MASKKYLNDIQELYLFLRQSCEHISASNSSEVRRLRCSLSTLPLVLKADSDATVVTGTAKMSCNFSQCGVADVTYICDASSSAYQIMRVYQPFSTNLARQSAPSSLEPNHLSCTDLIHTIEN